MDIQKYLQEHIVYLDGGMGTLLQAKGLSLGELPERWNLSHADVIEQIHLDYLNAGSNVIATNTFGANPLKFSLEELEEVVRAGVENAKAAISKSATQHPKWVALDVGPCGKLLKPYGDLDFEDAVEIFAKTIRIGVKYGVDLILIETMNDSLECKAAVLAAKENANLPIFVSCAYGNDGKLLTGASPAVMTAMLEGLGVDAIGVNCSVGPKQITGVVEELLKNASIPVFVKPNAGLPVVINQQTAFDVTEDEFAQCVKGFLESGVRLVGGCCGTTPDYIKKVVAYTKTLLPVPLEKKEISCISSYTKVVTFEKPVLIGERINPTGKKRFKQALIEKDVGYVLSVALSQEEMGAQVLDVNVGIPEVEEAVELPKYVQELQAVTDLPLQIDTSNYQAMERALRLYNGKPLINSVNGKQECMDRVFPLVKKYGGMVVGLTLDEDGIPETAQKRLKIAEKIILEAEKYGIERKNILIDPLAMTIASNSEAANVTLEAVEAIRKKLGVGTSLGVSNVSFGLPNRDAINATFFTLALEKGLSAAIVNPNSVEMLKAYYAYLALKGHDKNFTEYIQFSTQIKLQEAAKIPSGNEKVVETYEISAQKSPLKHAIVSGLKENAAEACTKLLQQIPAQEIIESYIVPALDEIGQAYEAKKAFLPQLLMAAEAAKTAFERIKSAMSQEEHVVKKAKILLATVKGDVHDIGKNIVATMLENYGYNVIDLGKDVAPNNILEAVKAENPEMVGLSALMTTTVCSMEETICLLKEYDNQLKIMVGGAVLTQDYAEKIKADGYAKDAMGAVRLADLWTEYKN